MHFLKQNSASLSLITIDPKNFLDSNHRDFYYLYNHPANNIWMYYATRTEKEFRSICENFFSQADAVYLLKMKINEVKKIIGTCRIKKLLPPRQHVIEITSVTIEPSLHGKSYGKKFFTLLFERLKIDFPEVFRYELSYGLNNPVAYLSRFYEKIGFKDEVVWNDYFFSGTPNYDEKNNPYKTWLIANGGDLRHFKNCWYADEIVAAYFNLPKETIKNYQPSQKNWENSAITAVENGNFIIREAAESDLDECVKLYFLSEVEWGFLEKETLRETLYKNICNKNLWLMQSNQEIPSVCYLQVAPGPLKHVVLLQQVVTQIKAVSASSSLFESLLKTITNNYPAIKRIEINITDKDLCLAPALIVNGFQYRGTFACRVQTHDKKFLDEHVFEKLLFNLDDIIVLCQNRLQSELFFKANPQITYPFNMLLTAEYLQNILKQIAKFQHEKITNNSLLVDEHTLYNIIKVICTQDAIPVAKRLEAMHQLQEYLNNSAVSRKTI